MPRGYLRLKLEKDGHEPVEIATVSPYPVYGNNPASASPPIPIPLPPINTPQDMVYVPADQLGPALAGFGVEILVFGPFLIDKTEVSNRQFKEFVDQSGYQQEEYWQELESDEGGSNLSQDQILQQFVDSTGRPGPANWELGNYPAGQDDCPVTGISWYEAVAYARFRGKELPTLYHWARAAYAYGHFNAAIDNQSNFSGAPRQIEASQAVGPYGTQDMAGNVREWVWNQSGSNRWVLGGAWSDPSYMSALSYNLPPMSRDNITGFRLVQYLDDSSIREELLQPADATSRDYTNETPVSDEVYAVLQEQLPYTQGNLQPVVEMVDDSTPNWTREKVLINTDYDNERFAIHLFKPKTAGPHEAVLFFPGLGAFNALAPSDGIQPGTLDYIISSGRALVFPVYAGSFERYDGFTEMSAEEQLNTFRQWTPRWRSDLGRTLDYLETRDDIAPDSFAYLGISFGASSGAVLLALEERLKAAVLIIGGFSFRQYPTIAEPLNYVSRITLPVLMLNGRYDYVFPVESR